MWTQNPEHFPNTCGLSGLADKGSGPYFTTELFYRSWDEFDERIYRLYISRAWLESNLNGKESPVTVVDRHAYDKLVREHHELGQDKEALVEKSIDKMLRDEDSDYRLVPRSEYDEMVEKIAELTTEVERQKGLISEAKEMVDSAPYRQEAIQKAVKAANGRKRGRPRKTPAKPKAT